MGKSCYMHFKPTLDRVKQTCARIRCFDTNLNIKLNGTKLSKVKSTKFLGVVIDDQLTWEPQVEYLKAKLISSIVTIKRIKPFIPKTEYEKVYNALFMSHLSYCISCWGGIPNYKLGKIFSKKSLMTALNFTSPVHAFVLIINIWNTKVTVLNTQNPYLMNIKYSTLKTFIFTTCSWRFLRFSNIAFHVL